MNRRKMLLIALPALAVLAAVAAVKFSHGTWQGVDETVVNRFARDAGHPATQPFINTDQGDLLLFLFLVFGAAAGFVGGYIFRGMFPPKKDARRP